MEKGLAFTKDRYFECKFSLGSAYRATTRMLDSGIPVTALFCMSDIMAIGAAKAIHDRGLSIPGDVSLIGFDGLEFSRFYTPSLATVRQPAQEIAQKSVEALGSLIQGEPPRHITVQTELLLGQSISTGYRSE